jgi:enamine deaminase RidA (YjgF/YER057c/UK114 family)
MIYISGLVAQPVAPSKPTELGDTRTQTLSILRQMDGVLKAQGFSLGDVIMMRVFLAPDPAKGGKMDYDGMMEAYKQAFGTPDQPNKPARVTVQVAGLVGPTMLAEIEAQAAKLPAAKSK